MSNQTAATRPEPRGVFIFHAAADRDDAALPLAQALERRGVPARPEICDPSATRDPLAAVDDGLARRECGVVIFTRALFALPWRQRDYDRLVALCVPGNEQRLIPVWHNTMKDETMAHAPQLADTVGASTGGYTFDEIAAQIAVVAQGRQSAVDLPVPQIDAADTLISADTLLELVASVAKP